MFQVPRFRQRQTEPGDASAGEQEEFAETIERVLREFAEEFALKEPEGIAWREADAGKKERRQ